MSLSSAPSEEASTPQAVPQQHQQQQQQQALSSPFKPSSLGGSTTTPRLLFTWDPYRNIAAAAVHSNDETAKQADGGDGGEDGQAPSSADECPTPSSAQHHNPTGNGSENGPSTGPAAAAQPPLTISSLLSGMGSSTGGGGGGGGGSTCGSLRSPQLSANAANATAHTPHQPSAGDGISAHSTPSGPVLKRISTSAKDGRQYFLDYSPTTAAGANPAAVGGAMPNLMLPPNLSPPSRGVSPLTTALPQPQQQQQQQQPAMGVDALNEEYRGSHTTSPQAIPLVSPPRSSSIGAGGGGGVAVAHGPYAYSAFSHNLSGSYGGVYGSSPQQRPQSSSLLGNSMNSGVFSASIGSVGGGVTHHNPYRTSPNFYPVPAAAAPPPSHGGPPAGVQRMHVADTDADLYEVLETTPSLFIKRLLPPPPPLPEVARVLPTPGVVQTLCERWCSLVEAVLRSREFSDVTTQPPPPPPVPSPTDTSPTGLSPPALAGSGSEAGAKEAEASSPVQEELRAWYEAAVAWYEELDQAGAATVDIRASSRTVAHAIEVAASGRGRRGGAYASGNNNNNGNNNGRYHGQGGRGGPSSYRGRGGGGHSVHAAMGGYRGGGGGRGGYYNPAAGTNIRGAATEMETAANSSGNTRNGYYPPASNFNPYAESWTFSGETQLPADYPPPPPPPPPPPMMMSKPPYTSKMSMANHQGYSTAHMMGPM